ILSHNLLARGDVLVRSLVVLRSLYSCCGASVAMSGEACDFIDRNREPLRVAGILERPRPVGVSFGGGLLRRRFGVGYAGGVDASFSYHHFELSDWSAAASRLETWLLGFILVHCRHRYGYKYGGVHREPAAPGDDARIPGIRGNKENLTFERF
ncbi:unnamed protein product, partial [Brassica oleracea var. botrytis]